MKIWMKCSNPTCDKTWILRCSACKSEGYCSSACQRQHWIEGHKSVCKMIVAEYKKKRKEARIELLKAIGKGDLAALKNYVEGSETDVNWLAKAVVEGLELSPLMMAAYKGQLDLAQFVVESGAELDKVNGKGETAVLLAARKGRLGTLQFLVEHGADMEKGSNDGASPLYVAAENGHSKVLRYLIEKGADKEKTGRQGSCLLTVAALEGHLDVVQSLIELGADVNKASTKSGCTPLHNVAIAPFITHRVKRHRPYVEIAKCLMERGLANLYAMNKYGLTPMETSTQEEMKQAFIDEEIRRRDHGFKRSVIPFPPPTTAEQENNENEEDTKKGDDEDDDDSGSSDEGENH